MSAIDNDMIYDVVTGKDEMTLDTVIRRIAAETMPGTEKERQALMLADYMFPCWGRDVMRLFVQEEREAAS